MKQTVGEAKPHQLSVVFLPFLRLGRGYKIAGVEFLPLRDNSGAVPPVLESAVAPVDRILSGYVDRHGKPFTNCVVATVPGKDWNLTEDDFGLVEWAASLLFLASWASNEYFQRLGGPYLNSTHFRVVGQRFTGPLPTYIAISARRRDGHSMDGGYKHGKLTFSLPIHCSIRDCANVDEAFLQALDVADAGKAATIKRLRTALPFVQLANTDDDFMMELSEAILMGSAFEQLLRGKASAYKLSKKFGDLFKEFGSTRVSDVRQARPTIQVDASPDDCLVWCAWKKMQQWIRPRSITQRIDIFLTSRLQVAHFNWWIHRKWIEELYDLRSKAVHQGRHTSSTWGWSAFEHLVMAAHVFPLTVKLLLVQNGHYQLSDEDRSRCLAVDKLLSSTKWVESGDTGKDVSDSWTAITSKVRHDLGWKRTWEAVRKEHPDIFIGK